jgi:hypothetical protein
MMDMNPEKPHVEAARLVETDTMIRSVGCIG